MTFVPKSNLHSYGLREPDNDLLDRTSLNDLQTSVAEMALIPKLADPDSCCVRPHRDINYKKRTVVQWDIGAVLQRGRCRG
jgi:hypothetical protein